MLRKRTCCTPGRQNKATGTLRRSSAAQAPGSGTPLATATSTWPRRLSATTWAISTPGIVAAIQQQAGELCFIHNAWGSPPRAELARLIIEKSGLAGGKVFFTMDGAEATEHAIKMARWITGRRKIIGRFRSYHGATSNAIALSGDSRNWTTASVPDLVRALPPYCYRCPFGQTFPGATCAAPITSPT